MSLPRILFTLGLVYLTIVLFGEAREAMNAEVTDQSRVVLLFGSVILVGLAAGAAFVLSLLPAIGDWVGNLVFNPNEKIEKAPHSDALAAVARGDYPRAIEEYRKVVDNNARDTLALSEIARLQAEKLKDPAAAAASLEEALENEWAQDEGAFLRSRLAEVYWTHLHDVTRARAVLLQVIESSPNTRHAANAQHRLQEIERQLAMEG